MEFTEFRKQVEAGPTKPAYLLCRFGSAEAAKAIQLLQQAPRQPAVEVLRESFLAPEQVSSALVSARSHPMWGEHKLILLNAIETLEAKTEKKRQEALVAYLRDPSPWVTLVMVTGKDAQVGRGLSALTRRAALVNAPKLTGAALGRWVRRQLAEARLEIEPRALETLLQGCKEEWTALEKEIEKMVAAFPPGTVIGSEALAFMVEPRVEESVFNLLRLLAEGQTGAALEKLDALLGPGRHDRLIHVWYWLHRQTRELLGMAEVVARDLGPDAVEAIGINPRAQAILRRQLKSFPKPFLRQMLPVLEQVDRQLKSSYTVRPKILLERYVIRLGQSQTHRHPKRSTAAAGR